MIHVYRYRIKYLSKYETANEGQDYFVRHINRVNGSNKVKKRTVKCKILAHSKVNICQMFSIQILNFTVFLYLNFYLLVI